MTSKEANRRYNQSVKGKARNARYEKYEKGIATRRLYIKSGRRAEAQRERNNRIQDEYEYYSDNTLLLYVGRLIDALEQHQ